MKNNFKKDFTFEFDKARNHCAQIQNSKLYTANINIACQLLTLLTIEVYDVIKIAAWITHVTLCSTSM